MCREAYRGWTLALCPYTRTRQKESILGKKVGRLRTLSRGALEMQVMKDLSTVRCYLEEMFTSRFNRIERVRLQTFSFELHESFGSLLSFSPSLSLSRTHTLLFAADHNTTAAMTGVSCPLCSPACIRTEAPTHPQESI